MTTNLTQRFASLAFAAALTVAMLAGINGLAVSNGPDALLAHVAAGQRA